MNRAFKNNIPVIFLFFFGFPLLSHAQQDEIKKEVQVVKPYEPTLSGAFKINVLPKMDENIRVNPDYEYSITPRKMVSDFDVRPISAAKMVSPPLSKYYKTYLKLGLGNYFTPMAQLSINSLRSKDLTYGVNFNHQSSAGKVTLANDEKVFAGYGNTQVDMFGKKLYRKATLSGNLNLNTNTVYNYGYNPEIDTTLEKSDIKQTFLDLGAGLNLASAKKDSSRFHYALGLDYNYFQDLQSNKENIIAIKANMGKGFNERFFGADISTDLYVPSDDIDSSITTVIGLAPYLTKATSEWRFFIGANVFLEARAGDIDFALYPNLQFEFNVIPKIMVAYLAADGYWDINNYRKLAYENHFILPGLTVEKTRHKLISYAGLKGNFSSDITYNLRGTYSRVNDLFFFVNDTISEISNFFHIEQDDVEITEVKAQVSYSHSEKLTFDGHVTYKQYTMDTEEHPWHYPAFRYGIEGHYNLQDKIIVNAGLLGMGKRYAKVYNQTGYETKELKGILNINLGIEYRYSKILSGFITISNLTANKYQHWNYYPSQKLLLMGGFTYSL